MRHYTYLHRRADDGRVFYVGKGVGRRAHESGGRSTWWGRVAGKHGYNVEVLCRWATNIEAYVHEQFLIACFRDLGAPLVNCTDGGPGASGITPSPATKQKQRLAKLGRKLPAAHRARIGASLIGRPVSAATRAKLSAATKRRYQKTMS